MLAVQHAQGSGLRGIIYVRHAKKCQSSLGHDVKPAVLGSFWDKCCSPHRRAGPFYASEAWLRRFLFCSAVAVTMQSQWHHFPVQIVGKSVEIVGAARERYNRLCERHGKGACDILCFYGRISSDCGRVPRFDHNSLFCWAVVAQTFLRP